MQLVLGVLIAIALVATLVCFTLGLFAQRFIEVDAADRRFGRESKRAADLRGRGLLVQVRDSRRNVLPAARL
jgi:hypothetical protein